MFHSDAIGPNYCWFYIILYEGIYSFPSPMELRWCKKQRGNLHMDVHSECRLRLKVIHFQCGPSSIHVAQNFWVLWAYTETYSRSPHLHLVASKELAWKTWVKIHLVSSKRWHEAHGKEAQDDKGAKEYRAKGPCQMLCDLSQMRER